MSSGKGRLMNRNTFPIGLQWLLAKSLHSFKSPFGDSRILLQLVSSRSLKAEATGWTLGRNKAVEEVWATPTRTPLCLSLYLCLSACPSPDLSAGLPVVGRFLGRGSRGGHPLRPGKSASPAGSTARSSPGLRPAERLRGSGWVGSVWG